MKHVKIYEELNDNNGPDVDDYVLISPHLQINGYSNIGKIIDRTGYYPPTWVMEFHHIKNPKAKIEQFLTRNDILNWSDSKEELEEVLAANKYNL